MNYSVDAKCYSDKSGIENTFKIETPNICPCCHVAWQPSVVDALYTYSYDRQYEYLYVIWYCHSCKSPSISRYCIHEDINCDTTLEISFPQFAEEPNFYKGIKNLSPSFVKIYNESLNAECNGLYEVAGVGYRKALEFLIKDYAISIAPNEKNDIEDMPLAKCVTKYILNPRISGIVERTVWLGNDQTHYKKKHIGKGIEDLKILLDLSVNYITMELQTDEALKITKK